LLYNWDAVSVYIPIAKTIVETGSLTGPNIYYQTIQTMYAPPLTPILMAFFINVMGDLGFRLVPIVLSIMMFLVIYDITKMFVERPTALALASISTIVTNPFYILYYVKESMYLDLGFIVLTLFAIYETMRMLLSCNSQTKQLLLWSIALALLSASKEYGVYISIVMFVIFIALLTRNRRVVIYDILSIILFMLPFLAIYLWDIYKLGLSKGVISEIFGSGLLVGIAFMSYRRIVMLLSSSKYAWNINAIKSIGITLLASLPVLLYYVVFALIYGVAGPLNLIWIQQKFIPKDVLSLIERLYVDVKPAYDINYMDFFAYDKVFKSVGGFVAIGSLIVLVTLQLLYTRLFYRGSEYISSGTTNDKIKLKLLVLLSLTVVFYYLGAVDISQTLRIVGTEYRRVLLVIAIVNLIAAILAFTGQFRKYDEKILSIWILINVLLHMTVIDISKIPYSYLGLLSPKKTLVSADTVSTLFGLLYIFIILAMLLYNRKISKRFNSVSSRSVTLILLAFLVMIIFLSNIIISWISLVLKYSHDPGWYNTIYSSVVYTPNYGSQWVKVYELLKDKQNAIILVEGAYPLAYFLNRSVIVYGNPHSIWFTTHKLLVRLVNNTNVTELYIIRNNDLVRPFSTGVFNIIKNILERDDTTKIRVLIPVLNLTLEILEPKTLELIYKVNYNNASLVENKKASKYKALRDDLIEWNITAIKTDWYILQIILPRPINLTGDCVLKIVIGGDGSNNSFTIELGDNNGNTRYLYAGKMNYNNVKTFVLKLDNIVAPDYPKSFSLNNVIKIKIGYKLDNKTNTNKILIGFAGFFCPVKS
jgi:hypothetical protein